MKFLKQLVILIFALVSIVLIVALFVRKDFQVNRTVNIERSNTDIYEYLRFLDNHENFTVWSQMDPHMTKVYSGPDGNVGSIYKWNSKDENVGIGEQEITLLIPDEKIEFDLRFKKPWKSNSKVYLDITSESKNSSQVTWGISGETPWPWNITLLFMDMDSQLGTDLETGLNNLKNLLEVEE